MFMKEVTDHLTNKIIPFWKGMHDKEYGGFYGYLDFDLKLDKKAVKGCILNSRILWFFSNAYMTLGDESCLKEAEHAYTFLKEHCIDQENGGIYWSCNYDGTVNDSTKHTYNQAFAIYALASYYDASGNQEALEMAWSIYHIIEEHCTDEYGYLEAFDRTFHPVSNEKLSENGVMAEKTMNTLLHVLEGYTELYRVTKDKEVGERIRAMMDTIAGKVYNPELRRQEVFFDRTWNSLIDLHSYGHDIETSWLVDRGCEVLGDPVYQKKMSEITKALAEKIYERAYVNHSLLNECEKGVDDTTRIWWVQAETVIGFLNAYQKQPEEMKYLKASYDVWNFIKEYMVDKRAGSEWFWCVDKEGRPTTRQPIVEPWKCPYHNGRMCMEIIKRGVNFES
ncbi:N-acylglucosamine 2-epimerase [Lachnospiraceae bacterium KM106-2]|nr:N-acylglucosamine 2-epimerase [Lachnospiraceae bacterium KM106-2]